MFRGGKCSSSCIALNPFRPCTRTIGEHEALHRTIVTLLLVFVLLCQRLSLHTRFYFNLLERVLSFNAMSEGKWLVASISVFISLEHTLLIPFYQERNGVGKPQKRNVINTSCLRH